MVLGDFLWAARRRTNQKSSNKDDDEDDSNDEDDGDDDEEEHGQVSRLVEIYHTLPLTFSDLDSLSKHSFDILSHPPLTSFL